MYRKLPAICFLVLAVYVGEASWRLGLGSLHKPGPGFMPFWSGVFIAILSLVLLVRPAFSRGTARTDEAQEKVKWRSITITLGLFLVYILCLEYVGYLLATALFVGALLKIIEKKSWILSVGVSVAFSLASWYLFRVLLLAELPKGLLGL